MNQYKSSHFIFVVPGLFVKEPSLLLRSCFRLLLCLPFLEPGGKGMKMEFGTTRVKPTGLIADGEIS
jgi:hypothetical protein